MSGFVLLDKLEEYGHKVSLKSTGDGWMCILSRNGGSLTHIGTTKQEAAEGMLRQCLRRELVKHCVIVDVDQALPSGWIINVRRMKDDARMSCHGETILEAFEKMKDMVTGRTMEDLIAARRHHLVDYMTAAAAKREPSHEAALFADMQAHIVMRAVLEVLSGDLSYDKVAQAKNILKEELDHYGRE